MKSLQAPKYFACNQLGRVIYQKKLIGNTRLVTYKVQAKNCIELGVYSRYVLQIHMWDVSVAGFMISLSR